MLASPLASSPSSAIDGPGENLGRFDQALSPRPGEVHAQTGLAGRPEVPPGGEEPGGLNKIVSLGNLAAVAEGDRLAPGAGEAEPDLSAGSQVVHEFVERSRGGSGYELPDIEELARFHGRLDITPGGHLGQPLATAQFGQHEITLGAQLVELELKWPHSLAKLGDPAPELVLGQRAEIIGHPFIVVNAGLAPILRRLASGSGRAECFPPRPRLSRVGNVIEDEGLRELGKGETLRPGEPVPPPPAPRQAERFMAELGAPTVEPSPPPRRVRPGVRRFFDVLLVAATAAALVAAVVVLHDILAPADRAAPTQPPLAVNPTSPSPSPVSAASLTLRAADLSPGFHAVQAGPAQFGGGAAPAPDSWDVVFQSGEPNSRDFRAAESIVLLYASPDAASVALRREQAAEPARGGRQLVAAEIGQETQVWEEPLSGSPDYRLVRVLFRVGRAMSEVTIAAPAGPTVQKEAIRLGGIQAERLSGL